MPADNATPHTNTARVAPGSTAALPDATSALYRAAVGPVQTDHYVAIFNAMDASERYSMRWNWAASLCTFNWLVFRKLWRVALYYCGTVVACFLAIFGIGRLIFQFSPTVELVLLGVLGGMLFALPGLLGDSLLHVDCRRRMTLALRSSNTDDEARAVLERQASTRHRLMGLAAINVAVLVLIALTVWQWSELAATAGRGQRLAGEQAGHVSPPTAAPAVVASEPMAPPAAPASSPEPQSASVPLQAPEPRPVQSPDASAPIAPPAQAVMGTPGRSAQGPVQWESIKIDSPQPDAPKIPSVEPKKLAIEPAWKPHADASTSKVKPAKTPMAAPPAKGPRSNQTLLINVGLFAQESNARNAHAKLLEAGLPATKQTFNTSKGPRTRVRAGPFATRPEAEAAALKIRALSMDAIILKE